MSTNASSAPKALEISIRYSFSSSLILRSENPTTINEVKIGSVIRCKFCESVLVLRFVIAF